MKENKVVLNIAVVLLGVVLAAVLIGGVVIGILNSTPKLNAKSIESNVKYKDSDEQSAADVAITGENFSITRGQAVPVEEQSDSETAENSEDYICPFISERLITDEDMEEILAKDWSSLPSDNIPQMMVNELYARHGYSFSNEDYQAYFESKQWYVDIGTYTSVMDEISAQLSQVEKDNVDYLKSLQEEE